MNLRYIILERTFELQYYKMSYNKPYLKIYKITKSSNFQFVLMVNKKYL